MQFKDINVRPVNESDIQSLEFFRRNYWDADLEIPHGYAAPGVETAVAEKAGTLIASLTAIQAVVLDPLISNPDFRGFDRVAAIYLLERTLSYIAQKYGAVDMYIAVPDHLVDYHRIVEKAGYVKTCEHCTVFRRPVTPDTVPLLGVERAVVSEGKPNAVIE